MRFVILSFLPLAGGHLVLVVVVVVLPCTGFLPTRTAALRVFAAISCTCMYCYHNKTLLPPLSSLSAPTCVSKLIYLLLHSDFTMVTAVSRNTAEPGPTHDFAAHPLYPHPQLRRLAKVASVRKVQKPTPSSKCWHGLVGNA